jgi:two-component system sensor histidine kinase PhoQ
VVQGLVLRYGLAPLRRAAREVAAIQAGSRTHLSSSQPRELEPLTENLNALIHSAQTRLERYRSALAQLAHSLKTPLAVLRTGLEAEGSEGGLRRAVAEQTERMNRTIDYQLQRAAASGRTPLAPAVEIQPVADRLLDSLRKVYADKALGMEVAIDPGCRFPGDEGDLAELLGNLLDNACKWATGSIRVQAGADEKSPDVLLLSVDDDGPGVPEEKVDAILAPGVRADAQTPGGRLAVLRSDLGGARVQVRVPLGAP